MYLCVQYNVGTHIIIYLRLGVHVYVVILLSSGETNVKKLKTFYEPEKRNFTYEIFSENMGVTERTRACGFIRTDRVTCGGGGGGGGDYLVRNLYNRLKTSSYMCVCVCV